MSENVTSLYISLGTELTGINYFDSYYSKITTRNGLETNYRNI